VQGGTLVKPFVGRWDDGPSDAAVLKPLEVSGSWRGLALSCAFNPAYGAIDPYAMAVSAIDEAVRNAVAVGADPERIAILDNFCWGNPLLPDRLGGLVRACKGCYDGAVHYGTPFISGKDSLNNEYTDGTTGQQVAIPPSLLISAIGIVPDVRRCCTLDLKARGNLLYILGETRPELGGSSYYRLHGWVGNRAPAAAETGPATARALHRAISAGLVCACHDCSEGGLGVALAEMALAAGLGAELNLADVPTVGAEPADGWVLFAESNGRYLVEVAPEDAAAFEALLEGVPHGRIGVTRDDGVLLVTGHDGDAFTLTVEELRDAWRGHLNGEEGGR
jgi:phosphoribosylformylglycinamidine synthase subunit PurSL